MTTATKTQIKPTWTPAQTQEAAARSAAAQCAAAMEILSKQGEAALTEYKAASRKYKVAALKEQNVQNALELATKMAEFEANVYGSQIEVEGNEQSATLTYNSCAMWNAYQKLTNMNAQEQEKMAEGFQTCMQDLAKEFGLNAKTEMGENTCAITFTK